MGIAEFFLACFAFVRVLGSVVFVLLVFLSPILLIFLLIYISYLWQKTHNKKDW